MAERRKCKKLCENHDVYISEKRDVSHSYSQKKCHCMFFFSGPSHTLSYRALTISLSVGRILLLLIYLTKKHHKLLAITFRETYFFYYNMSGTRKFELIIYLGAFKWGQIRIITFPTLRGEFYSFVWIVEWFENIYRSNWLQTNMTLHSSYIVGYQNLIRYQLLEKLIIRRRVKFCCN